MVAGGCKYDMGVGFCLTNEANAASFGCASGMEDYAVSKISPHVPVLIGMQLRFIIMNLIPSETNVG